MAIPLIDFCTLNGEKRGETMALLHEACQKWGLFRIENHEVDKTLMEKVKQLINIYYEENLKESFYQSEIVKSLEKKLNTSDTDWESAFFIWHLPISNIKKIPNFSKELGSGDSMGTKVAKYPKCPHLELVRGLREHIDACGIILLLQDDQVPGLEFFKDGKWVEIPPSKNNAIFVNTGDQVEVLSNGLTKMEANGSKLSVGDIINI
ncbi:1-aminocyclopropane-1-carboxylate oxidase 1 [Mucuna pruriens]|uniref:1-aminocyclopropane-1-carboxylate oxidase 1 n=1 Tax=Mucuna pruriens TaxID=157652 RepID=A0A371GB20_MUCPR|nr:1-aminocyclopropane-1-carboxylate oxidase 1 [Mucuna pruriens]